MQLNSPFNISVNVTKQVFDAVTGGLLREEQTHNLFVDAGLNILRNFLNLGAVTGLNRFAIGTGTAAVTAANTLLGIEVFRDQFTQTTTANKELTVKYFLSSGSANGNIITEAGLFGNGATNTANSGTLFARVLLVADQKTSAEAWTITWIVTLAAA